MSTQNLSQIDDLAVATVRGLAIDMIQKANSGHPGLPLGIADVAYVLWQQFLKFDPSAPNWPNRDRFVLSAGHGSSLLYALLHVYGYDLPIEELKNFRQLHSKTPGHPEYGHTVGVEITTGPLGQGLCNAVGMAIAEERGRQRFGKDLIDHYTYAITGDGCLQEGVSAEASSLAGHLGLGRLIVLYDSNHITIDGRTELTFTEDVGLRYQAYGWQVLRVDGHDRAQIAQALLEAKADNERPSLIICTTTIGKGSPKLAGSHKVHGAPLGPDEVAATKRAIGLDAAQFFAVAPTVAEHLRSGNAQRQGARQAWEKRAQSLEGQQLLTELAGATAANLHQVTWPTQPVGPGMSTRKAGEAVLKALAPHVPQLFCGSADLGHSTFAVIPGEDYVQKGSWAGRNIHWGIREHAMGAVANGLAAWGGYIPVVSTFMVFHDYMRPAVRLAALMGLPVIYAYTHDSIFVGEDGPTHQPVETLAAMRTIPNLVTLRPADLTETCAAYAVALQRTKAPTALALTRQNVPELPRPAGMDAHAAVARGGYVLSDAAASLKVVLIATGSEVHLAMAAQVELERTGCGVRVVSMPSIELFDAQAAVYRREVLPLGVPRLCIEAGSRLPWLRFSGETGDVISIDTFGASAPDKVLANVFGLTVDNVVARARRLVG